MRETSCAPPNMENHMTHLMALSDEEKRLVESHRRDKEQRQAYLLKQQTCDHDYRYAGHSHNDDAFECRKCGHTDFR